MFALDVRLKKITQTHKCMKPSDGLHDSESVTSSLRGYVTARVAGFGSDGCKQKKRKPPKQKQGLVAKQVKGKDVGRGGTTDPWPGTSSGEPIPGKTKRAKLKPGQEEGREERQPE